MKSPDWLRGWRPSHQAMVSGFRLVQNGMAIDVASMDEIISILYEKTPDIVGDSDYLTELFFSIVANNCISSEKTLEICNKFLENPEEPSEEFILTKLSIFAISIRV